jgi:hypothetical protein
MSMTVIANRRPVGGRPPAGVDPLPVHRIHRVLGGDRVVDHGGTAEPVVERPDRWRALDAGCEAALVSIMVRDQLVAHVGLVARR